MTSNRIICTMYLKYRVILFVFYSKILESIAEDDNTIEIVDLTRPTEWKYMSEYYYSMEKRWKICVNCGVPGLGTAMHLEHLPSVESMRPALIPSEYLLTRMVIVDVSTLAAAHPTFMLTLDVALQWQVMKYDPREPTLLVFKFGWTGEKSSVKIRSCNCHIPGISYELAEWIATNLTHVMGVATDAPTLESEETREYTTRTIANLLGKNGVYIIENILIRKKLPEHGCMAFVMPLKLLDSSMVPTRLTAFCPTTKTDKDVVVALRHHKKPKITKSRVYDVSMEDLMQPEY